MLEGHEKGEEEIDELIHLELVLLALGIEGVEHGEEQTGSFEIGHGKSAEEDAEAVEINNVA